MKVGLVTNRTETPMMEEYGYLSSYGHKAEGKNPPVVGLSIEAGISGVPEIKMEFTPDQAAHLISHLASRLTEVLKR